MTTATKKKAAEAAVSAPPADGIPSQIAYLTRVLKTPTIGRVWEELADHARDENWSHEEYLAAVLGRQLADRESAGTIMRIRTAHFPAVKTLEDFNLDHLPSLRRDVLAHLATGMFVPKAETSFCSGLRVSAKRTSRSDSASKPPTPDIPSCSTPHRTGFLRLTTAHHAGQLETELKKIRRYKLIVIDEVGYIPFDQDAANLFFQLIASRYEQGSVMVTSNLPFGKAHMFARICA